MLRDKKLVNLLSEMFGMPRRFDHGQVEVDFNCPKCDHGRNKFNMVTNIENHVYHCWACGYKGKVSKLFWDYGSQEQTNRYKGSNVAPLIIGNKPRVRVEQPVIELSDFRSMKVKWTDSLTYNAAHNYLKSRSIDKSIISKWDICYSESGKYAGRIIIPSRGENGRIEYFVARDIFGNQRLKYMNPEVEKTNIIFGEMFIDWKKPLILTEGVFDAMVLYNSIPLLGAKIEGHNKLLKKIFDNKTTVILGFDGDSAGKKATIDIGKYLLNFGINVYTIHGNKYGDLAKAYEEEGKKYMIHLIRTAKEFDELDMVISGL